MSGIGELMLQRWRSGACSAAVLATVRWWLERAPAPQSGVLAALAGLLQARQEAGDVAVELARWCGQPFPADEDEQPPDDGLLLPTAEQIRAAHGAPWLGDGIAESVLVHRDGLLLSWRHHRAELAIVAALRGGGAQPSRLDVAAAAGSIARLFADDPPGLPQALQRVAIATVLRNRREGRRLSLLTGGPGTGKTTTIARLLATLLLHGAVRPAGIRIAAPTGKAADRLAGALRAAITPPAPGLRDQLPGCPPELRALIPAEAVTLHRLLGANPASGVLRHHAGEPLDAELVVLDEASMVDPVLLAALLAALAPEAHLVLVGDPHQLTSVESGCLLPDLCAITGADRGYDQDSLAALAPLALPLPAEPAAPPLRGLACALRHNFRSAEHPALAALAEAVLAGERRAVDVALAAVGDGTLRQGTPRQIAAAALAHAHRVQASATPGEALTALASRQVLCALRRGPWGAQTLATAVDELLRPGGCRDGWYHGRAVLVSANDRARGLSNGDVGLCWDGGDGLRVHFPRAERTLSFATADLPAHEPAWALTVHKAQGSEYGEVDVVLPPDPAHALATRELLYTAVTRARSAVRLWGSRAVLDAMVARPSARRSGLVEAYRASG